MTSFTYDTLQRSVSVGPTKVQREWNKHLPAVSFRDWTDYYSNPFSCTSASKLRSLQYKIFHRL